MHARFGHGNRLWDTNCLLPAAQSGRYVKKEVEKRNIITFKLRICLTVLVRPYLIYSYIGSRRKLPRVDLEASVDLGESLRELKNFVIGGGSGGSVVSGDDTKSSSSPRDNGPPSPS